MKMKEENKDIHFHPGPFSSSVVSLISAHEAGQSRLKVKTLCSERGREREREREREMIQLLVRLHTVLMQGGHRGDVSILYRFILCLFFVYS